MTIRWRPEVGSAGGTRGLVSLPGGRILAASARPYREGHAVILTESRDGGREWRDVAPIVVDPNPDVDLGDGCLARIGADTVLYIYRHNFHGGRCQDAPRYAVRVQASRDGGRTWQFHSTVTEHAPPPGPVSRGLWAPSLLVLPSGDLLALYDDEETPFVQGFRGHQWLTMRRWNGAARRWLEPVTVSRAHEARLLSRDGMGTLVTLGGKRLLCVYESVQTYAPHANVVRFVLSEDGGRSWSWQQRERGIVYEPRRPYMALCPHLVRLHDGTLVCAFCTDEDRATPDTSGTPPPRLNMDVKLVTSGDGRRWSRAQTVYADSHRCYLPGLVEYAPGLLLATWVDFTAGKILARRGTD